MNIIIKTKNGSEIDESIKSYAEEKMRKFEEIVEEPAVIELMLSDELGPKGGKDKAVRIVMTLPNEKNPIHVETQTDDFMASIDIAQEKLEQQLVRYKEKTKIGPRYTDNQNE